jgi:hypothetical protein
MTPEELRDVANRMAHSLGISLYINEGWIYQTAPANVFIRQKPHTLGATVGSRSRPRRGPR